jgi:subtilisin family serine protease
VLLAKPLPGDVKGVALRNAIIEEANRAGGDRRVDAGEIELLAGGRLFKVHLKAHEDRFEARTALDRIAEPTVNAALRNRGIDPDSVTHNHVVSICHTSLCPADEPYPVTGRPDRTPPRGRPGDGRGVNIRVIDTGLIKGWRKLLDPKHVQPGPSTLSVCCASRTDERNSTSPSPCCAPRTTDGAVLVHEPKTHRSNGTRVQNITIKDEYTHKKVTLIREYAGHGTFIAGIIQQVAPSAMVHVTNDMRWAGATTEACLGEALLDALRPEGQPVPDIISLSAGGRTRGGARHLGLDPFYKKLKASDTLLVAAAGNDGDAEPFWPAAFADRRFATDPPAVISVGALREDGRGRACFSNYGQWVSVYESGERYVNAFPSGSYRYVDPPTRRCWYHRPALYCPCTCMTAPPQQAQVHFDGLARWSGTSFATPHVAARIAAYMSRTGLTNARSAAAELLAEQCGRITDVADHLRLTVFRE